MFVENNSVEIGWRGMEAKCSRDRQSQRVEMNSSIQGELDRQASEESTKAKGPVCDIAAEYAFGTSSRLLRLVLKFDFAQSHFATCDPWKRRCGGVPRGSFVLFRLTPQSPNVA